MPLFSGKGVFGSEERKAAKKKGNGAVRLGLHGIKAPVRLRFTQFMIRSLKGLTLGKEATATRAVTSRSVIGRTRIENQTKLTQNSSNVLDKFFHRPSFIEKEERGVGV